MAAELRNKYPEFAAVSLSLNRDAILQAGEKKLSMNGSYVEPSFISMLSLDIIEGNREALNDNHSILLSATVAKSFFGSASAINKTLTIDQGLEVKVAGVYPDFPHNSSFKDIQFIGSWNLVAATDENVKGSLDQWDNNSYQVYVQLRDGADFKNVSAKIKDIRMKREQPPAYKPEFFIHPMRRWHLYSDFKNGVNTGGLIQFVWLFGVIGLFVLLLACINFMNLSTARSEKRAKEVGVRKVIGSVRSQLILQFFSESVLVALIGFILSVVLVQLSLPFFNNVSGKKMELLWLNPVFWLIGFSFSVFTGLVAGSYPALYLSSFQPISVLKRTFRTGRFAATPRKFLVVVQFTVSVILIIGTVIVFRQVQYAKDRPVGYDRYGLIEVRINAPALSAYYNALRTDLINAGVAANVSASSGSVTVQYGGTTNISWKGKTPDMHPLLMSNNISHDYGNTVGWTIRHGRDFSRQFSTDSMGMILNETALGLMKLKNPLDETVKYNGKDYHVIGIVKDMIKENPFAPVSPGFYIINYKGAVNTINIRLSPRLSASAALAGIEKVFKKYNPENLFTCHFVDEKYAEKFGYEERIGKLAAFFATLAIFISCLGLFGVASFVAEQRTKEIGVRKVLGASVFHVWKLLSKEFVFLVTISLSIAIPVAYYFMHRWLLNYEYKTQLSWWIFAIAGAGAIVLTLVTVSFQAIKAAIMNPVKSLRTE